MTNPNNGATLEDCHSNFFALADLCGIKWRRMVWDGTMGSGHAHHSFGPLDDPVLSSFARCLAADVLCVWRRTPHVKVSSPVTPHDPFQGSGQTTPQPHFMNHNQPNPGGPPQMQNNPHMQPQPMMPPHMNMMGPGHLTPHHLGGTSPYLPNQSSHLPQHPHGLGMHPQPPGSASSFSTLNPSLNGPKELWLFWYGEDPDLSSLVNPLLLKSEPDQGSWESGLSYECRTLLFKSLHNLIERCLLARDFVRIGKWFIQPCDDNPKLGVKSFPMQLSLSFAYFVHGESTVCMSVDVRQHPSVRRITKQHLASCQIPSNNMPVILAPHGLAGTLTGVGYRMNEPGTYKILEEWKHFYPVEAALKNPVYDTTLHTGPHSSPHHAHQPPPTIPSQSGIPPVLEVIVGGIGGVRMRYPSCYVLCTDMDEFPKMVENSAVKSSQPDENCNTRVQSVKPTCGNPVQEVDRAKGLLPERVWQESVLCSSKENGDQKEPDPENQKSAKLNPVGTNSELQGTQLAITDSPDIFIKDSAGQWDFTDPTKKSLCSCSPRSKRLAGARVASSHCAKGSAKFRGRKTFHRRNTHHLSQADGWPKLWDLPEDSSAAMSTATALSQAGSSKGTDSQNQNHASASTRISGAPGTPTDGPSSKAGPASSAPPPGSDGAGASPASVAPSPLPTPRSQQPGSIPMLMPTLSPQPNEKVSESSNSLENVPKSVTTMSNQGYSPLLNCFDGNIKKEVDVSGMNNEETGFHSVTDDHNTTLNEFRPALQPKETPAQPRNGPGNLRPALPSKDYEPLLSEEKESQPSEVIYDYTSIESWLQHPVKKMKTNEGLPKTTQYNWGFGMKRHPGSSASIYSNGPHHPRHPGKGHNDPYEFDDENHVPTIRMEGLKRKDERIKEEVRSPHSHYTSEREPVHVHEHKVSRSQDPGDLFTSQGLKPSYSDLDQIFDNSDSSSDEILQVPTPPGSNKPSGGLDDNCISSVKYKSGLGILRPEELSKMFPTPPSHEHNPIASPCGLPDNPSMDSMCDSLTNCIRRTHDNYSSFGSPPDEPAEASEAVSIYLKAGAQQIIPNKTPSSDVWSFVYKPPTMYKMLGSPKYAALQLLPSQQLPPLSPLPNAVYKPSWQFAPPAHPPPPTQPAQSMHHAPISHQHNLNACPPIPGTMHLRPGLSPISPVPNSLRGPHGFDLGSPPPGGMYMKGPGLHHPHGPHGPQSHPGHHHMYGSRGLEAHALVVNLSLSDSVINLFRDHNFDSCTMCVCNAGNRVVGNIRGSEVGVYIPDPNPEEDAVRCNCGFSASVNRRLAHKAGLFYEDEYEITTPSFAPYVLFNEEYYEKKKPSLLLLDPKYANMAALLADKDAIAASTVVDTVPPFLLEMLREQCLQLFGTSTASRFTGEVVNHRWTERTFNYLEYLDGNRAAHTAMEHGRTVMLEASGRSPYARMPPEENSHKQNSIFFMHKWPYLWARGPQSSQEVMQVMKALLPLLQDAVHAKAWDAQYNVSGPLTWRQFHRLAGRGTDDRCEPQPIPSVLVGSEKDWVALSPLAIKFWEKLLLEPYAYPRDVGYFVVAPDNEYVLQKVRTFFRELSAMYEVCQLGRHCPITKVLSDGILRVGRSAATQLASEAVDEWFTMLPDIPTAATLRLYAQVCRHYLAPQLAEISLDQSLLDSSSSTSQNSRPPQEKPNSSPKMPPPNSDPASTLPTNATPSQGPATPKSEFENDYGTKETATQEAVEDERDAPAIVIYLIEPFGFGSDNKDLHRMASLGLLRCFSSMLTYLPENIKNNITLQIISLEDIMNTGNSALDDRHKNDQMRALSLTVYSQCRRLLLHQNGVKSLTGFGPAAAAELFLKGKDGKKKDSYRLYTPPFVLAPIKEKVSEGVDWLGGLQSIGGMVSSGASSLSPVIPTSSSVLYVAYCISEDHRWLLASATDDRGELVETATISIYVPNRSKRRKASARKHGLNKLMDFILGIMSTGVQAWRLVVGRLGRVGHGELESWSALLSRKSLLRASSQLKDSCRQCSLQYPLDTPCVLSACLVSLEPDSCLRLMPDQFTPDERFGIAATTAAGTGSSTLSTPHDVTCTHILVFPTSATTQSSQTAFQEQHINCTDMGDDELLFDMGDGDKDITDGIDGMPDLQLGDIFSSWDTGPGASSPVGSPRRDSASQPGSPGGIGAGRQSPFQGTGQPRMGGRGDGSDELGTLLQQPLALGYFVSTAPSGQLPPWFWASCPQRASERGSGIFFKSALHLHSHSVLLNLDDLLQQQSNAKQHPLDSQFTTDVLRFVLEGYNALSWLCLDPKSHDRKSCLPVHIQKLLQLYYTIHILV